MKYNLDSISSFAEAIKDTLHSKAVAAIETRKKNMAGSVSEENEIDEQQLEDDGEIEISFDPEDLTEIVKIANEVGISYEVEADEITITEDDNDKIDVFFDALDEAGIVYGEDSEEDDLEEGYSTKGLGHSKDDLKRMISKLISVRKKNEKEIEKVMDKADQLVLTGKESNPMRGSLKSKLDKLGAESKDIEKQMSDLLDAYSSTNEDLEEGIAKKRVHTSARDKAKNKKSYRKNKGRLKIKSKRYRKTSKAKRLKKIGLRKAKQGKTATGRRQIKRI